jgi:hypothetical protein
VNNEAENEVMRGMYNPQILVSVTILYSERNKPVSVGYKVL